MRYASVCGALLFLFATGCAARSSADAETARRQPTLITREEIVASNARDAHELVARLRPNWMAPRGAQSFRDPTAGQVNVYFDDVRAGFADALRGLHVDGIASIRYLNDVEAAARFGFATGGGGAILVTSRVGN